MKLCRTVAGTGRAMTGIGALLSATFAMVSAAAAQVGHAAPNQMMLQTPVTAIGQELNFFHNVILLPIITIISVFVLGLLIYVAMKFNEKANPTPSKTTHHTGLEVAWTVIPVMILVIIAIPSFRLLTHQLVLPEADVTVKVTGNQWNWTYAYPKDQGGGFEFVSKMLETETLPAGKLRLLDVDNEAVVPVNKTVRFQVTADAAIGVIHSFVVPSFGIRIDAVPGRLNETWFKAEREGVYYGQCSKLCGKDHAFMPIVVRVVSDAQYQAWLAEAPKKFAGIGTSMSVASIEASATK